MATLKMQSDLSVFDTAAFWRGTERQEDTRRLLICEFYNLTAEEGASNVKFREDS